MNKNIFEQMIQESSSVETIVLAEKRFPAPHGSKVIARLSVNKDVETGEILNSSTSYFVSGSGEYHRTYTYNEAVEGAEALSQEFEQATRQ